MNRINEEPAEAGSSTDFESTDRLHREAKLSKK